MTHEIPKVKRFLNNYSNTLSSNRHHLSHRGRLTVNLPLCTYIRDNPEEFFKEHADNKKMLKILNIIMYFVAKHNAAFPDQSLIAKLADCSRSYVNKVVKYLANLGIISKFAGISDYDPLIYRVNDFFRLNSVRSWLYKYLPNCIKLAFLVGSLLVPEKALLDKQCSPYYTRVYLYKKLESFLNRESYSLYKKEEIVTKIDKESDCRNRCDDNLEKGRKILRNFLKNGIVGIPSVGNADSVGVVKKTIVPTNIANIAKSLGKVPTEKDIPVEQMEKIRGLPEHKQKEVIRRVLRGRILLAGVQNE